MSFGPAETREGGSLGASEGVIRKGRFSEDQIIRVLREADGESVAKVAKRHGATSSLNCKATWIWIGESDPRSKEEEVPEGSVHLEVDDLGEVVPAEV